MSAGKNKRGPRLLRAYLFKWWTPEIADIVERQGADIAWYFETTDDGRILTLHARSFNLRVSQQVVLNMVESCRFDMIADTLERMMRLINTGIQTQSSPVATPERGNATGQG